MELNVGALRPKEAFERHLLTTRTRYAEEFRSGILARARAKPLKLTATFA